MARKDPRIEAAEDELIACMGFERRLPDRERGWLYKSTLRWPAMLRDQGDYPGDDEPRRPLTRRERARCDAMFDVDTGYVRQGIAGRDVVLVRVVAWMKARGGSSGFGWGDVWNALGGMLCYRIDVTTARDADGVRYVEEWVPRFRKVSSDAMRMRYAGALLGLAGVMGQVLDGACAGNSTPAGAD